MFGQVWNNGTIRKYVIYFGTLFNQVYLQRDNSAGDVVQTMKVPLNYGPKEKFLARLEGNPNLDRPVAITLPRMSFEIINIAYDSTRKLSTVGKLTAPDPNNPNKARYQYNPIPYNFEFSLYIMVKNAEDGTRIVEQILPFFAPEWTATLNLNKDLGVKYDIPVILESVMQQDTYEGNFEERRAIIWTLNFTMKGYIFGPTRTGGIISQAETHMRIPPAEIDISDATTLNTTSTVDMSVRPGMTANGQPINYYGDSDFGPTNSLDRSAIGSDDNYGFITEFEENIYVG